MWTSYLDKIRKTSLILDTPHYIITSNKHKGEQTHDTFVNIYTY